MCSTISGNVKVKITFFCCENFTEIKTGWKFTQTKPGDGVVVFVETAVIKSLIIGRDKLPSGAVLRLAAREMQTTTFQWF